MSRTDPVRRRGPRKGDLTEQRLLTEAGALLASRPLSAIGIDELAAAAGISRSSFYFYFASREALLCRLAEDVQGVMLTSAERWLQRATEPPAEAVLRTLAESLALWRAHGPVLRALYDMRESGEELRALWRAMARRLLDAAAAQIERERAAGLALPGPPEARVLASVLVGMNDRAFYEASRRRASRAGDEQLVGALGAVWLRAVYRPVVWADTAA